MGLRYETIRQQRGPTDAERKLEELTRQLEVEMRLSPPQSSQSLSSSRSSSSVVSHSPFKLNVHSLPSNLQRAEHTEQTAVQPSCGKCHCVFQSMSKVCDIFH